MKDETLILKVEKDGDDGVIVKFSDGTTAGYVVGGVATPETAPGTDR